MERRLGLIDEHGALVDPRVEGALLQMKGSCAGGSPPAVTTSPPRRCSKKPRVGWPAASGAPDGSTTSPPTRGSRFAA